MRSATLGTPAHAACREVGSRQVELYLRMAASLVEGSISLKTAHTARVDPGVTRIMALAEELFLSSGARAGETSSVCT